MKVADGLAGQERAQRALVLGSELLHFGGHARQRYLKSPPYTPSLRRAKASLKSMGLSRAQRSSVEEPVPSEHRLLAKCVGISVLGAGNSRALHKKSPAESGRRIELPLHRIFIHHDGRARDLVQGELSHPVG